MLSPPEIKVDAQKIDEKVVDSLYLQALASNSSILVVALLFYFILDHYSDSSAHFVWSILLSIAAIYRLFLWHQRKYNSQHHSVSYWKNRYIFASTIVGFCWGSIFFLPYINHDGMLFAVLLMVVFGVTTAAVSILSSSLTAFYGYTLPIILGFTIIVYNFKYQDLSYLYLIIIAVIYFFMLCMFARNSNKQVISSINLHIQNKMLIVQLHEEIEQREVLIKARTEELEYSATHDGLTGLFNRVELEKHFQEELARAERYEHHLSIFMIDIDFFKWINDSYGHQAGDQVLREFAVFLQETVRATDYIARYGGEEFVVILHETTLKEAEVLAERLRVGASELKFSLKQIASKITISIGVATYPQHAQTFDEILEKADAAMYHAKQNGRNRVCTAI